jgi:hypothetical protein
VRALALQKHLQLSCLVLSLRSPSWVFIKEKWVPDGCEFEGPARRSPKDPAPGWGPCWVKPDHGHSWRYVKRAGKSRGNGGLVFFSSYMIHKTLIPPSECCIVTVTRVSVLTRLLCLFVLATRKPRAKFAACLQLSCLFGFSPDCRLVCLWFLPLP